MSKDMLKCVRKRERGGEGLSGKEYQTEKD